MMVDLDLDPTGLDRYSRQIVMDDVGPAGQARLLDASVLVIGAGGLGSPVIAYLAGAGIGQLGIVDDDVVERSNLQRQILHTEADLGRPKVESACEFVTARNPDIAVETHETRLAPKNVRDLIAAYDIVVDGSDNFRTRFLVNDACTIAGIPYSHGAVFRFEGQVTTFAEGSPCYRCLFREAPPDGTVPDCATAGVLGVLPGTIGTIQATEAVKLLLGHGTPLNGRLLAYDAERMRVDEVQLEPDPECPVCGDDGINSIDAVTYEGRCAVPAE